MKKTDIALIIIIVSLSAAISWWVASVTIGKGNDEPIMVRIIDEIQVDDEAPVDEVVFSKDAINPTVEVTLSGEDITSFMTTPTESEGDPSVDSPDGVEMGDDGSTDMDVDGAPTNGIQFPTEE